jgi:hypothetical protein
MQNFKLAFSILGDIEDTYPGFFFVFLPYPDSEEHQQQLHLP